MNIENAELNEGMLIIPQEDGSILCIPEEGATTSELELFAEWRNLYPDGKSIVIDAEVVKSQLIQQASLSCRERIYAGFDSSCLGEIKHFDCEDTDQQNITALALVAMMGLQGLTSIETHWKCTGELECYKFEYAQILQLAMDMKIHVQTQLDQFNAERIAILAE